MTENNSEPITPEAIAELITQLEQYRQRLVDDMTETAKKAKLSKSKLMSNLEPELAKIDATLENLRHQYSVITNSN
jgi:hypothetical protein